MANIPNDEESLRLVVEEQRRDYDYLLRIYERAGAKENVLLTATFGIIAYLYYAAPAAGKLTIAQRLFVPDQDYGKIIYFLAAGFFVYGLFRLIMNVFGNNEWETAYESNKNNYDDTSIKNLSYYKNRYDIAKITNLKSYKKRKDDLTFCFYCILISAIVLIVIKTLR